MFSVKSYPYQKIYYSRKGQVIRRKSVATPSPLTPTQLEQARNYFKFTGEIKEDPTQIPPPEIYAKILYYNPNGATFTPAPTNWQSFPSGSQLAGTTGAYYANNLFLLKSKTNPSILVFYHITFNPPGATDSSVTINYSDEYEGYWVFLGSSPDTYTVYFTDSSNQTISTIPAIIVTSLTPLSLIPGAGLFVNRTFMDTSLSEQLP